MGAASSVLVGIVAALHIYFLVLEMFLWTTPFGQRTFGRSADEMRQTKALAANQGLYNGFLAAGLVWANLAAEPTAYDAKLFFLACVAIAGVFGAATASKKILFVQALPAVVAAVVTILAHR